MREEGRREDKFLIGFPSLSAFNVHNGNYAH